MHYDGSVLRSLSIGNVTVEVSLEADDFPYYESDGEHCNFRTPMKRDEYLVHNDTGLILGYNDIWRNTKGQIQAVPEERYHSREYLYTFHTDHSSLRTVAYANRRLMGLAHGDWGYEIMCVKVSRNGEEIGVSYLGGIESDVPNSYLVDEARFQIKEAIADARSK